MLSNINRCWSALERWSPTLFLIGGGGVVTHAALMGIEAFTTLSTLPDVFVTTGHLIALVGLLGLFPVLVTRTPRLARLAVTTGSVAIAGWTVLTVGKFAVVAGAWSSLDSVLPGVFFVLLLCSSILTYVLFGSASLRSGHGSRSVVMLVFAPGALMAVLLLDSIITGLSAFDGLVIGGGLAFSMLALGYKLRRWPGRGESLSPAGPVVG